MTITPEQIKRLAEAQRENPELDLLRDYDGAKLKVIAMDGTEMAIRWRCHDGVWSPLTVRPAEHRDGGFSGGVFVTDAGREWLRINGGEWIEAGGDACKVRVRYKNDKTEMVCIHLDERISGEKSIRDNLGFKASNGFVVGSVSYPALDIGGHEIFLLGRVADRNTEFATCEGNHVAAIITAVNEANAAWELELEGIAKLEAMDKPSPGPDLIASMRALLDKLEQQMKEKKG